MNRTMANNMMDNYNDEEEIASNGDHTQASSGAVQRFGETTDNLEDQVFEGQCYLKTKTDRYKEHWAVLAGNELYCYR
jgi:hypothetical protein